MPSRFPGDAGERDRLVIVQQSTDGIATSNYPTETWTQLTTMFMSTQPAGGRERFVADQFSAPYDTRWEGPYRADMDPELVDVPKKRRLVYRGRIHNIVQAEMIGRYEGVALLTQAGGLLT